MISDMARSRSNSNPPRRSTAADKDSANKVESVKTDLRSRMISNLSSSIDRITRGVWDV